MKKGFHNQYFILRHGQTIYQTKKKKITYPWPDNPPVKLTKKGIRDIQKGAEKLKNKGINLIFSSDIFRTKQTAGIVAKTLGSKVYFDKRLRDLNLGVFHGGKKEKFYRLFPNPQKVFFSGPKKGESWNDVKKRTLNFLKETDKKYKNKKILIISHGDPLWLLEGLIKGLTNQEMLEEKFVKRNYIKTAELRELIST